MTPTMAIARQTTTSLLRLKRVIGLGLLELGPALIFLVSSITVTEDEAVTRAVGFAATLYFPVIVPIVAMVTASSALGSERRDNTLSFLVLRPISRTGIAGAKIAGAAIGAIALNAIGAFAIAFVLLVVGGGASFFVPLLAGGAIASLAYVALFVPIGFLTDRAVIVGLIFVFIFENGVASALPAMATLSPWRIGFSAFVGLLPESVAATHDVDSILDAVLGDVLPGLWGSLAKVLVLTALSVAFTAWLLRVRDLTSGD